ncbi:MAG: hypothetical protein LDL30_05360 [Desulfovibrio sp.]|nr:hypothetical protein [Desulfovibrio sp.]MCA1985412.1 hypothetical protein [Desulfovibrio sp.]
MPPSLQLNILRGNQVVWLADGLVTLHGYVRKLDGVCRELGVAALSSFFDTTTHDADLDELDLLIDDGAHLAERGAWHDAAGLLATLQALHQELAARPRRFGLLSNNYPQVLDELTRCLAALEPVAAAGASLQAHLLVVG